MQEALGLKGVQTPDETELNALKERVKSLSSEKTALEGQLKKALPVEERLAFSI